MITEFLDEVGNILVSHFECQFGNAGLFFFEQDQSLLQPPFLEPFLRRNIVVGFEIAPEGAEAPAGQVGVVLDLQGLVEVLVAEAVGLVDIDKRLCK